MTTDYLSLLTIVAAATLCPIIAQLIPRKVIPEAVLLLLAGAVFGPHMLGAIQDDQTIQFMAKLGLAFQFLIAGYEIDPKLLTGRRGAKGFSTWAVTFALALGASALLFDPGENFMAFAAVAIAMTSTALGTLIGIMKERDLEGTGLGDGILSYGVWGQLCPVIAIALLLSTRRAYQTLVVVRALPVFVAQSLGKGPKLTVRNRAAVAAYVTTALSIIVVVSSTAVEAGALTQAGASLMISGAAISVFLMPLLAQVLFEPEPAEQKPPEPEIGNQVE